MAPQPATVLGVLVDVFVDRLGGYGGGIFGAKAVGDLLRALLHLDFLFNALNQLG